MNLAATILNKEISTLTAKEIALIKAIRSRKDQTIIVKTKDGDILLVDRIETTFSKENEAQVTVEKREKLYPV